ncbi:hypothetical protein J437_LFUL015352 [Ladona fulva]|uniref:Uncharacterized protein n=1 Tax=Ladona fulva TaxID=123851 RepID=A0A8K0P5C0_LADFU|nr:hypothetical protein J437_LFUL015352 [Ladona fulva]
MSPILISSFVFALVSFFLSHPFLAEQTDFPLSFHPCRSAASKAAVLAKVTQREGIGDEWVRFTMTVQAVFKKARSSSNSATTGGGESSRLIKRGTASLWVRVRDLACKCPKVKTNKALKRQQKILPHLGQRGGGRRDRWHSGGRTRSRLGSGSPLHCDRVEGRMAQEDAPLPETGAEMQVKRWKGVGGVAEGLSEAFEQGKRPH